MAKDRQMPEGVDIEEDENFVPPEMPWEDPGPMFDDPLPEIDEGDPDNPDLPKDIGGL